MLFNSYEFLVFFPIVYCLYWLIPAKRLQFQNFLILLSSYYFYACWDIRFLFLLIFSTVLDYVSGILIDGSQKKIFKKIYLTACISINLGFLFYFKYFNFVIDSLFKIFNLNGTALAFSVSEIILPIGISFYTFHGLSYVLDIYNSKIKPTKNFISYSLFVSFFPLLVAGPIERATHLLPQIISIRKYNFQKSVSGLRQILWGFFKKVVVADSCSEWADKVFNNPGDFQGISLLVGAVLFSFQIYCDFSGYSDIALGSARLLGFELLQNFKFPYFSRDVAEFWRRWHISLSSWFRDYLYFPLGGSKGSMARTITNVFIIFLVSGLWHGANYTFIFWGGLNAALILPSVILSKNRDNIEIVAKGKILPHWLDFIKILFTFFLVTIAWIFFRSPSLEFAFDFIIRIFQMDTFHSVLFPKVPFLFIFVLLIVEWIGRENKFALEVIPEKFPKKLVWIFYALILITITN